MAHGIGTPRGCIIYGTSRNSPKTFVSHSVLRNSPRSVIRTVTVGKCYAKTAGKLICVQTRCPLTMRELGVTVQRTGRCNLLNRGVFKASFSFSVRVHCKTKTFIYNRRATLVRDVRKLHKRTAIGPPFPDRRNCGNYPAGIGGIRACTGIPIVLLGKTR